MKAVRCLCAVALILFVAPAAQAQESPKPGPEHEILKKMAGNWDLTMKIGGMEIKGTGTNKMDLGGLWLVTSMECEFGGVKAQGKGFDTYDFAKKKYVSVFVDSQSTSPLVTEGTYDKATRTLTMEGTGPGFDGKPMKYKSVTVMPDDDTINITMYMGEGKDAACSVTCKRKK
jgi:hypothetical protein